jgi:hypothetical protein
MVSTKPRKILIGCLALSWWFVSETQAIPNLSVGAWTDLTPYWLEGTTFQTFLVAIDPGNRDILYLTGCFLSPPGLIKSTDRGSTWFKVGTPPSQPNYGDTVSYLDSPYQIEVDPANSQHQYCTEMAPYGGVCLGFWVTWNNGATWVRTKGFMDAVKAANGATDVGHMDVDPTDFSHVLVSSHYYWNNDQASGVFESKDGGATFIVHYPPAGMCCAGHATAFLYNPKLGIGDNKTWLVTIDNDSYWRTSDAGTTWAKVSSYPACHGGTTDLYYTHTKVLYVCSSQYTLLRSTDNGINWSLVPNLPYAYYYSVGGGDGKIYTTPYNGPTSSPVPFYSSPDTDGVHWTPSTGDAPNEGTHCMKFDSLNHILYSANGTGGIWALRTANVTTQAISRVRPARSVTPNPTVRILVQGAHGLQIVTNGQGQSTATAHYDIKGRMRSELQAGSDASRKAPREN